MTVVLLFVTLLFATLLSVHGIVVHDIDVRDAANMMLEGLVQEGGWLGSLISVPLE